MSTPRLLEELLDYVVDHLHGERDSLKSCCLVSKSWIPRTRRQLFATISLRREQNLQSWKDAFPDPSASPGRYTKTLAIGCPQVVTTADTEEGGWLSAFARIVRLAMYIPSRGDDPDQREISLVPFHRLFPAIRSLRLHLTILPSPSIFRLIYSFPPLENLHVEVCKQLTNRADDFNEQQSPVQTPNPPAFTGSLKLYGKGGWNPIIHSLLSLPGGLHFRSLGLTFTEGEDFPPAMALVERCRSTLESLNLSCGYMLQDSFSTSIDLSRAKKLKRVSFSVSKNPRWIIPTLRTITPVHHNFQQISLAIPLIALNPNPGRIDPSAFRDSMGEAASMGWSELDLLLAQLRESHSIRPEVKYTVPSSITLTKARRWVESLLPEVSTGGMVDITGKQYKRTIQKPKIDMVFDRFLCEE